MMRRFCAAPGTRCGGVIDGVANMSEIMALALFLSVAAALMAGFPVAFTLSGVALLFAGVGVATDTLDAAFLAAFPSRVYGIMSNETLIAVPVFVFMGVMLERSKLADQLLQALARLLYRVPGGLGISVMAVGVLMAASTGIVGFGELLIVKHNEVCLSAYGHNDRLLVSEGDTVSAGQRIAEKGSSGTDRVKLHFEIRKEGKPVDPQWLLPRR